MSLFEELKRRNVFRVGLAYILLGWALLQGADFALDLIGAPEWVIRALAVVVVLGLPIASFFAWAFELTPEGIKREADVDRSESIAPITGRRLDRAIILFLVLVIAAMGLERFWPVEPMRQDGTSDQKVAMDPPASSGETTPDKSIAVLPFLNMSADAENEYFSDGVSEEILNVLASVPDLKVASRTSAFRYKGSDLGIGDIAEELGVTHVLEGSVRKSGDQVRVTAQLIQASDGFHLWSESYDRELTNIFAIQDQIAGSIAEVLQVQLLGQGKGYTTVSDLSPDDYEAFLKARFLMRQRNEAALEEAVALTRAILENEPQFPEGMMLVAEALVQLDRADASSRHAEVRALAERALALEPALPTAHMIRGNLAGDELRPLEAIRHYERAIALDPGEPRPHHWLGIMLANSGYLERAREELQRAVELEPDHANANGSLGFVLMLLGDYDGAQYHFDRQDQLGNPFGAQRRVQIAVLKGDLERAEALLERREGFNALEAERLRLFTAAARDPKAADAYLDFLDEHAFEGWHVELETLILGRFERALAFDLGGYPRASWADRWAAARELPAFEQKIRQANLPAVWDALGPPPACRKLPTGYDCANGERP